ncbi:hypothetical protein BDA99DRAFT_537915 [Phascolomyces articulosus]|uniref:Uncharacterized protein n=1 Tax=Phascolomyces articulosus TaxID=60185 RepID=A0AAD5JZ97_9FUNG|nr:hypothetical protein BDA99DRAFT_537915 [Phascolomyces articulosus]
MNDNLSYTRFMNATLDLEREMSINSNDFEDLKTRVHRIENAQLDNVTTLVTLPRQTPADDYETPTEDFINPKVKDRSAVKKALRSASRNDKEGKNAGIFRMPRLNVSL